MVSPAYKAQDQLGNGESSMRMPPENTQPIGKKRYPYGPGDIDKASRELKNPIANQLTSSILERGQNRYKIYCGVCHGLGGQGDGTVAGKMPVRPPSLVSSQVKSYTDGYLYHVIVHGKGVMGSYANQVIKEDDRWAIVNYIRSLQKLTN